MPRIRQGFLDCVIYLYPSVEGARQGVAFGGTGFLVAMKSEVHSDLDDFWHQYAVTNHHVVNDYGGAPVIRFNAAKGGTSELELVKDDWLPHPDGDDLAVTYLGYRNGAAFKNTAVLLPHCISSAVIDEHDIGPGDDVYTVGRFISHGGIQHNEPCVRSGIISMMPSEPIEDGRGHPQECFLIEIRALRGSSGSPVFVSIRPFSGRETRQMEQETDGDKLAQLRMASGTWLLGIAFADLPYKEEVMKKVVSEGVANEEPTDYVAYSNSGQTAVIPAWKIRDFILTDERFVMARKMMDEKLEKIRKGSPLRPTAQKQEEPNELTPEGFEDVLKKVFPKPSQPVSEKKET